MNNIGKLLLLALWILTETIYGQTRAIDSLKSALLYVSADQDRIDVMNKLAYEYFMSNPDSTLILAAQSYELSGHINYELGKAGALNSAGVGLLMTGKLDSALLLQKKARELATLHHDDEIRSSAINNIGLIAWKKGKLDEALKHFETGLSIMVKISNQKKAGQILTNIGLIHYYKGDYSRALDYYQRSYEIQLALSDSLGLSRSIINQALIYKDLGNYVLALKKLYQGAEIQLANGDKVFYARTIRNIATLHMELKELDKAEEYLSKGLSIHEELNDISGIGESYIQLAKIEGNRKNYLEAIRHLQNSLRIFNSIGEFNEIRSSQGLIGEAYMMMNQLDSAEYYVNLALNNSNTSTNKVEAPLYLRLGLINKLKKRTELAESNLLKAYNIAKQNQQTVNLRNASLELSRFYKEHNRFRQSLNFYEEYSMIKDSIFNRDKLQEISRLEEEYLFNQEIRDIQNARRSDNLKYEAKLELQKILLISAICVAILIFLLALTYYKYYNRKKKAHALLKEKNSLILMQKGDIEQKAAELKRGNERLIQLSNFKEGLTHMIAHDMKNSLNAILTLSEQGRIDRRMRVISQSGRLMLNLVTNMLDVQKFEETEVQLDIKPACMNDIFNEARLQVELLFAMKNLEFEMNISSNTRILVDADIITRVLVNLLTNAIKYSNLDSKICLDASEIAEVEDTFLKITVTDEGEGISNEKLPYIFDKFWQGKPKSSGGTASTGLGLTFCKLAIDAHQGRMEVESEIGVGSKFHIFLPVNSVDNSKWNGPNHPEFESNFLFTHELEIIKSYASELNSLKVHQASRIYKIISDMDTKDVQSRWKDELQFALRNGNQEDYEKLVGMIKVLD